MLSKYLHFICKAAAIMLLPLLAWSCQWMKEDYNDDDEIVDSSTIEYINISISVSADNNNVTRAPQGGEYGDGFLQGINNRENAVEKITLIFYQDNAGINTTNNNAEVSFVKTYSVYPTTTFDYPNTHTHKNTEPTGFADQEIIYTTGNQKLEETPLQVGQTYKVLVVANADVIVDIGDKISTVREKVLNSVYTGTGAGIDASHFVMSSEADASVTLTNPTIDTSDGKNKIIYYFNCIHIERLAARIDYNTKGGTYDENLGGYRYSTGTGNGFFVITKVTPFNLYNEREYLFKRVQDAWPATSTVYLGDESTTNYVVDPNTANKDNSQTFSYLSPVSENMGTAFAQTMNNLSQGQTFLDEEGFNNVIIAYPRENTLMPTSSLKRYATGIAFETYVYVNATATPVRHVYYHYLRHQGELATGSYQAKEWEGLSDTEVSNSSVPMNFGVVRNNIYSITIESLNVQEGILKLKIEEEKWRHVDNPVIYI